MQTPAPRPNSASAMSIGDREEEDEEEEEEEEEEELDPAMGGLRPRTDIIYPWVPDPRANTEDPPGVYTYGDGSKYVYNETDIPPDWRLPVLEDRSDLANIPEDSTLEKMEMM